MNIRIILLTTLLLLIGVPRVFTQDMEVVPDRINYRDSLRQLVESQLPRLSSRNADSMRAELERSPFFTLYKDNYLITGFPLGGGRLKASDINAKFQLSISQRLTRSRLPFDTYLFIQFTQRTLWNILEESLPIYDMTFNPGIGLGHLIIHDNRHMGHAYLLLEHESNGKDGLSSRSWNRVTFGNRLFLGNRMEMQFKIWVPIIDSDNNRDITRYCGISQGAFNYRSSNGRLAASLVTVFRSGGINLQCETSFKMNNNENQYLFLQYSTGYGETLLDYSRHRSLLRFGFVIKPQGFSMF